MGEVFAIWGLVAGIKYIRNYTFNGCHRQILNELNSTSNNTPLHYAVACCEYNKITSLLNDKTNHSVNSNGRTALHYAAQSGQQDISELLLKAGFDPKLSDKNGFTPYDLAARNSYHRLGELIHSYK